MTSQTMSVLFLACACLLQTQSVLSQIPVSLTGTVMNTDFEEVDMELQNCPEDKISFEMVTAYVYSAPADMLDSMPGVLSVTECLEMCKGNSSCYSVNYETGLCVLFKTHADIHKESLALSDFPVFTIYVQKKCYEEAVTCDRAWTFDRVIGYELVGFSKKVETAESRTECQKLCLNETEFPCRSANYNNETSECSMSDMDRNTVAGTPSFKKAENVDYLENACVDNPVRLCEFQRVNGRVLKTVDTVIQGVKTLDECKNLCLQAEYRCRSFDHNDTGEDVCRLSHHSFASLSNIRDPYLEMPEFVTYEMSSCYNVTIDCRSGEFIVKIQTSKIFDGKVYAKGSPNTCVNDISNEMNFEIEMSYTDEQCGVRKESEERYHSDIVIQHHDTIVTSADLGLAVHCHYDLSNKSVSNKVDLQVKGDAKEALEEGAIVESPNVMMRITDRDGSDIIAAAVGDMLQLRFEIVDPETPYEIFISNLTAVESGTNEQISLLDHRGCPSELSIMRPMLQLDDTGKLLGASFDAFKFPSSEAVEFRAIVTPCLPKCEPVVCDIVDFDGHIKQKESYGRKKRSLISSPNVSSTSSQVIRWISNNHVDVEGFEDAPNTIIQLRERREAERRVPEQSMLKQTIIITDKFGFKGGKKFPKKALNGRNYPGSAGGHLDITEEEEVIAEELSGGCINTVSLVVGCSGFLLAQLILIVAWTAVWQRRRRSKLEEPLSISTTTESLRQLYDSGYPRRV